MSETSEKIDAVNNGKTEAPEWLAMMVIVFMVGGSYLIWTNMRSWVTALLNIFQ
jgi:hypothetical protein